MGISGFSLDMPIIHLVISYLSISVALVDLIPIDDLPNLRYPLWRRVLVIYIVGMLPYISTQKMELGHPLQGYLHWCTSQ